MNWIDNLNKAIVYLEENMTEEIDYKKVARIACCSSYHFQRMFAYIADVPLSEYIRRRKMSLAALDLQTGKKVINVALKYGYSSPTAFNRAFQSVHGIAPSRIKELGVTLKSYPLISFKLIAKGVDEMKYRIEKKDDIRILGVSAPFAGDFEKSYEMGESLWERVLMEASLLGDLNKICDSKPEGAFGIGICYNEKQEGSFEDWIYEGKYIIGMPSTQPVGNFEEYIIPSLTWAIFSGVGFFQNDEAAKLEKRIMTEWLPSSGYEIADGPDIHFIFPTETLENAAFEIWLPVKKSKS